MNHSLHTDTVNSVYEAASPQERPELWQTWGIGLSIVTVSAFAPPIAIVFVPFLKPAFYEKLMSFLVAIGIGALSGSIMFIMLPRALDTSVDDGNDKLKKSWLILGALYGFFIVDRVLQFMMELKRRWKTGLKNSRVSSTSTNNNSFSSTDIILEKTANLTLPPFEQVQTSLEISTVNNAITRTFSTRRKVPIAASIDDASRAHNLSSSSSSSETIAKPTLAQISAKKPVKVGENRLELASVAYMIIFGSSANNFMDGMSNGVAFADSLVRGLSVGLACIAQQFPQEVGTLAILVRTGLGFKKTLLLNLIPAILSYVGFIIGAVLDDFSEGSDKIVFAISSGMYLYIFLGTLIPEIREAFNEQVKTDLRQSMLTTMMQFIGISFGALFLYFMALYGSRIKV